MSDVYHIRAKKEYAVALIELLLKDGAIEDIDSEVYELTDAQKSAIDTELEAIASNQHYLQNWNDIKGKFKKP